MLNVVLIFCPIVSFVVFEFFYVVLGLFMVILGAAFYALCAVSVYEIHIITLNLLLLRISKFCYNLFVNMIITNCLVTKKDK